MDTLQQLQQVLTKFDAILMQPKRLLITTLLYLLGSRKESELVKILNMRWGDLTTHLKALEKHGYVKRRSVFTYRGPRTLVELTEEGFLKYRELVGELRAFLDVHRFEK
ncbi:MAG: transcriptional regulator [Candidatus Thermoplasmatota archaeon]